MQLNPANIAGLKIINSIINIRVVPKAVKLSGAERSEETIIR